MNNVPWWGLIVTVLVTFILSLAAHIAHDKVRNYPNYSKNQAIVLIWFEKLMRAGFFGTLIVLVYYLVLR